MEVVRREFVHIGWHGAHGSRHWARVRLHGLAIAAKTRASAPVVGLFAFDPADLSTLYEPADIAAPVHRRTRRVEQLRLAHHRQGVCRVDHRFALASPMRPSHSNELDQISGPTEARRGVQTGVHGADADVPWNQISRCTTNDVDWLATSAADSHRAIPPGQKGVIVYQAELSVDSIKKFKRSCNTFGGSRIHDVEWSAFQYD